MALSASACRPAGHQEGALTATPCYSSFTAFWLKMMREARKSVRTRLVAGAGDSNRRSSLWFPALRKGSKFQLGHLR
jgi:hypothetical protein